MEREDGSVGSSSPNNQEDYTIWSCSIRRTWGNGNDISVFSGNVISELHQTAS